MAWRQRQRFFVEGLPQGLLILSSVCCPGCPSPFSYRATRHRHVPYAGGSLDASLARCVQAPRKLADGEPGVGVWGAVQWRQMDLEYTMWQMMYLCIAPKTVYVPHAVP